jgi:replicative DNA helicase
MKKWKSKEEGFKESILYMRGRKSGEIKSFRTPWHKVNDAGTDGFEFHTIVVVGGRPGSGKTLMIDQIIREGIEINKDVPFRALQFQFEMTNRASALREYSSAIGRSYKYLCSADGVLSEEDLNRCIAYAEKAKDYPIDVIDEPYTVLEIENIIKDYMKAHAIMQDGKFVRYTNTVITLDHSVLVKKAPYEKDDTEMLYNLGAALTRLKKKYPICFIILTQLNRSIENPERCENGKYSNHVTTADVFGADSLLMHCDMLIALDRPALRKIKFYGPDKYIIDDEGIIVFHFLKCRNGDPRMSFFKANFKAMRIEDARTPDKKPASF